MKTTRKPSYIAYAVNGQGKNTSWTKIGTAWLQKSGEGFNIDLSAIPVNGRIILMPPKSEATEDAVEGQQ